MGNQIEGRYEPGQKIVVIEDLVSTGKSSLQAVDALEGAGLEIVGMVSIFTYDFSIAREAFEKRNIKYHPLTSYPVLLELAQEKGMIQAEQATQLLSWREDPANWTGV
ncbi:orotate phosphoribosyltransferase [Niabella ginsengisoli]|uniref:Orotate phosphoribosyltransferase n=1 Tax=Niabella ginsengisoli TaxID=522298 RepID=A0ABS9SFY0_9BACT|nr:hypothetical protein [Niabella ginsengisoli]MCH5597235.1 hypothetical protein [Niabella ginsengisoli]